MTFADCLLYAILPKDHARRDLGTAHDYLPFGVPDLLAVDNGPEFAGRDRDDACLQLGIELMRMPPRVPSTCPDRAARSATRCARRVA